MQQSIFFGLDLGSSHCHQTVINSDGVLVRSRSIPTSEQHLRLAFAALGNAVDLPAEASELAAGSPSIISRLVSRFVISHPPSLAWIAKDSQASITEFRAKVARTNPQIAISLNARFEPFSDFLPVAFRALSSFIFFITYSFSFPCYSSLLPCPRRPAPYSTPETESPSYIPGSSSQEPIRRKTYARL